MSLRSPYPSDIEINHILRDTAKCIEHYKKRKPDTDDTIEEIVLECQKGIVLNGELLTDKATEELKKIAVPLILDRFDAHPPKRAHYGLTSLTVMIIAYAGVRAGDPMQEFEPVNMYRFLASLNRGSQ